MSNHAPKQKRVVVVGGGIAGSLAAKLLEDHADVVLIDPKDHLEIPYARLRCMVEPEFADRSLVLHAEYLKKSRHVAGFAERVSETEVFVSSGDSVPYDYLVIATGTIHSGPVTKTERIESFKSENKKIKESESVLVVGGGPVGVELAGEIVVDFPEKKVTLVHGGSRLIEFLGSTKASDKAQGWLRKRNVEVKLNERVDIDSSAGNIGYSTSSGQTIEAQSHFVCVGKKISTSWIQSSTPFLQNILDETGHVKVDPFLRVVGHGNIFAAGDVTSIKEIKQGFLAGKHAQILAQNIKSLIKDPNSKLKEYTPLAKPMGIVSLGRHVAVAELPMLGAIHGWLPGKLKCKDLFVGNVRKELGLRSA